LFLGFLSSGFSAICELQLAFTATDNTYNMQLLSSKHSAICEPCCLQFVSAVSLLSLFSNLLLSVCFCVQQIVFSSQFRVDAMLTFVLHLIYFIQMSFRVFACDSINDKNGSANLALCLVSLVFVSVDTGAFAVAMPTSGEVSM
jgi:hypothetical protein